MDSAVEKYLDKYRPPITDSVFTPKGNRMDNHVFLENHEIPKPFFFKYWNYIDQAFLGGNLYIKFEPPEHSGIDINDAKSEVESFINAICIYKYNKPAIEIYFRGNLLMWVVYLKLKSRTKIYFNSNNVITSKLHVRVSPLKNRMMPKANAPKPYNPLTHRQRKMSISQRYGGFT